jgi:hypothetical protein
MNHSRRRFFRRAELRSALWYDERRPGLGDEFIAEVSAAFDRVADAQNRTGHGRARGQQAPQSAERPSNDSLL